MKLLFFFHIIIAFIVLLTSCGPSYKTDYPNPELTATPYEVFPEKINNLYAVTGPVRTDNSKYGIVKAVYGPNQEIVIIAVMALSQELSDEYVKNTVYKIIDEYPTHKRAKIDGIWTGMGTEPNGERIFAWQNKEWVYLLRATNNDLFDAAVHEFKQISE